MELSIDWDKDSSKPFYKTLGLHAGYNSNYQIFQCIGRQLLWNDNNYSIEIDFE